MRAAPNVIVAIAITFRQLPQASRPLNQLLAALAFNALRRPSISSSLACP